MQPIHSDRAPAAIGTYSQAICSGQTVYLSGQIPLDPYTMQLVGEDILLQIETVMGHLASVCHAAGGSLVDIVKLTVYLTDLQHFPLVNEVMSRLFTAPYPARAVVEVSALPRGARVEMDAIMVLA